MSNNNEMMAALGRLTVMRDRAFMTGEMTIEQQAAYVQAMALTTIAGGVEAIAKHVVPDFDSSSFQQPDGGLVAFMPDGEPHEAAEPTRARMIPVEDIAAILYPEGDREHAWGPATLDAIAGLVRDHARPPPMCVECYAAPNEPHARGCSFGSDGEIPTIAPFAELDDDSEGADDEDDDAGDDAVEVDTPKLAGTGEGL